MAFNFRYLSVSFSTHTKKKLKALHAAPIKMPPVSHMLIGCETFTSKCHLKKRKRKKSPDEYETDAPVLSA